MAEGCCSFTCGMIGLVLLLIIACIGLIVAFLFNSFGYGSVNAVILPATALLGVLV